MLVLSRRIDEVIRINDNIIIQILGIRDGDTVKVGVSAPRDVIVHRGEVWQAIQRDKAASERAGDGDDGDSSHRDDSSHGDSICGGL